MKISENQINEHLLVVAIKADSEPCSPLFEIPLYRVFLSILFFWVYHWPGRRLNYVQHEYTTD